MTRPTLFADKISAVGWSKIPEGGGSDFLLSLVEVGLTDLPKSGRGRAPPSFVPKGKALILLHLPNHDCTNPVLKLFTTRAYTNN